MIRYHGGPITPEVVALDVWTGRHAMVSHAHPEQLDTALAVAASVALDNGAFSVWRSGHTFDADAYYGWLDRYLPHPAVDWAVIPDVIGGTVDDNRAAIEDWPFGPALGVPVWHLDEPVSQLLWMAERFPRVAFGSAAQYDAETRPTACYRRCEEAFIALTESAPYVRVHGLRLMARRYAALPFASVDSTTVARNIGLDAAWTGTWAPTNKRVRAAVIVDALERPATLAALYAHGQLFDTEPDPGCPNDAHREIASNLTGVPA